MKVLRAAAAAALLSVPTAQAAEPLVLRYAAPAQVWTEALPVGNGRLGAMVFGGLADERLQLNDATLWSGGPTDWNNPSAPAALPELRAAAFAGDFVQATALAKKMQGPYTQSYQPLGDLRLAFSATDGATAYARTLDLERAVAGVAYRVKDAACTREVFSSFPDQVLVVRLACDRPGRVSVALRIDSRLRHAVETDGRDTLVLRGRAPSHVDPSYLKAEAPVRYDDGPAAVGMPFEARVRVAAEGGRVQAGGATIDVAGADAVTLLVSAATGFAGTDVPARAAAALLAARAFSYAQLLARHVEDHRRLFGRVSLDLGAATGASSLATDARVQAARGEGPGPHGRCSSSTAATC